MDNVWLQAKGEIWEQIIAKMKKDGYWKNVIKRTEKPLFHELLALKTSYHLPDEINRAYENYYEKLISKRYYLLDMLYRKTDWKTDRYNACSFHELSNRIRFYYDFFSLCLLKEKITLVVFNNTPHMGWDNILYEVARNYQIKILILDQSKFPNKFFHYFDFNDYGLFKTSKTLSSHPRYPIEKKVEKDWFYMKKDYGRKRVFSLSKLLKLAKYKKRVSLLIERNDHLRLLRELGTPSRRSQAFFRFYTERNYKKRLKAITSSSYSLEKKYVYFPLHTQPERATAIWGGIYLDQVLAIERLSRLIPDDWYIYVKEAPKQKGAYRDILFFDRLKQIPNLLFLSKQANTHDLIKNARFIATIVGTAGWEAITGGKNVLTFGWGQWYKTLPGVYPYAEDLDAKTLESNKIDHDDLEKRTCELYNKCGTGVIYDVYIPSVENFSMKENTQNVMESLKKILYEKPPAQITPQRQTS